MGDRAMREPECPPGRGAEFPPPVLQETMVKVMQELIYRGWDVADIAAAMRAVAGMSAMLDKTKGPRQ
ncbi:putative uncharacterized protein [Burkholderiales bacterium GJ-E10]|nr:putative uncharacterized protein [Burkholderiales bacterium GJ-E10]